MRPKKCKQCGDLFPILPRNHTGGTGYARVGQGKRNTYICYKCCGVRDLAYMKREGKITLYLSYDSPCHNPQFTTSGTNLTASDYKVSNWPGTLTIKPMKVRVGKHNLARRRWDCWFIHDGYVWHGVSYGDNTQLLHCKRTSERYVVQSPTLEARVA